jgi:hypothetical protein
LSILEKVHSPIKRWVFFAWLAAFTSFFYVASIVFFDKQSHPWVGYAENIRTGSIEFFFSEFEERRDCLASMEFEVTLGVSKRYYRAPYGCGFVGTSKWQALAFNKWAIGDDLSCITKRINSKSYGPLVRNGIDEPRQGQGWYCVSFP